MSEPLNTPEQRISHTEAVVREHPEIAGLQAYEYLRSQEFVSQRDAFIAGDIEQINPNYYRLTKTNLTRIAEPAKEALVTLLPGEQTSQSVTLYDSVEYRMSELSMLDASRQALDESLPEEERNQALEWFRIANEGLYGKPDKNVFSGLVIENIDPLLAEPANDPQVLGLQAELKDLMGECDDTEYRSYVPSPELVERVGRLVHERFDHILGQIDDTRDYSLEEIQQVLNDVLEVLGGAELGWHVGTFPDSTAFQVAAHQKFIGVGENRESISGYGLKMKIVHETFVHALRAINSENAGWTSAQYGMNGYLNFEEALATILENAYVGKSTTGGSNYYLIAGFALGLDNSDPRNFRQTYEVMWRYLALKSAGQGAELTVPALDESRVKAYKACVRMFKGTDMITPGVLYLKDLAYYQGRELAWSVLEGVSSQEDLDILLAGKTDLTKPDHLEVARDIARVLADKSAA